MLTGKDFSNRNHVSYSLQLFHLVLILTRQCEAPTSGLCSVEIGVCIFGCSVIGEVVVLSVSYEQRFFWMTNLMYSRELLIQLRRLLT